MEEVHWNRSYALEQTDGDEELLRELLSLFRDSATADLEQIRQAVAVNNATGVMEAAHSIKGAAATLGFEIIQVLAREIEEAGRHDSLGSIEAALARLVSLLDAVPQA